MTYNSILVVDSDVPFRHAICRVLRRLGRPVEQAGDRIQALQILADEEPAVLIIATVMPDCDPIDLIAAVKRRRPATQIMAMSGASDHFRGCHPLRRARRAGADAALSKGTEIETLFKTVEAWTNTTCASPFRRIPTLLALPQHHSELCA